MTITANSRPPPETVAGEALLHPLALAAVVVLVVNDHVLKSAWPSVVTGKLSDVAGLVFFPLFLQALWEVGQRVRRRTVSHSPRVRLVCVVLTALVFTGVQLSPFMAEAYRVGLGAMQWPFFAFFELLQGRPAGPMFPVHLTQDVTDLIALPALGVPLWLVRVRSESA